MLKLIQITSTYDSSLEEHALIGLDSSGQVWQLSQESNQTP